MKKTPKKNLTKKPIISENLLDQVESTTQVGELKTSFEKLNKLVTIISLFLVVIFVFQGYMFYQLSNINVKGSKAEEESPLSEKNLKKMAKDLKLNMKEFEKCYSSEEAKNKVLADKAEAASLNINGTPGFLINGRFLGGAFPLSAFQEVIDKELNKTATSNCADYSPELQQQCADPQSANFRPAPVSVRVGDSPILGNRNAPVVIIEYSDFECPFCARAYSTMKEVMKNYKDKVAFSYKHLPLDFHKNAQTSAIASVCADQQGKFWEYHDKIFETLSVN